MNCDLVTQFRAEPRLRLRCWVENRVHEKRQGAGDREWRHARSARVAGPATLPCAWAPPGRPGTPGSGWRHTRPPRGAARVRPGPRLSLQLCHPEVLVTRQVQRVSATRLRPRFEVASLTLFFAPVTCHPQRVTSFCVSANGGVSRICCPGAQTLRPALREHLQAPRGDVAGRPAGRGVPGHPAAAAAPRGT